MATYAIGDLQGCFEPLERLLALIRYDRKRDRLWLAGDLVNRGPRSLDVLRWAIDEDVTAILGNHDLHLLGVAAGVRQEKRGDTLREVLDAGDRDDLLRWLGTRPLLHRNADFVMVHAGINPSWTLAQAEERAAELERALARDSQATLEALYGGKPALRWRDELAGAERLRTIAASLTRLRVCRKDGTMDFEFNGAPADAPADLVPWFELVAPMITGTTVVFGHWAALGFYRAPGVLGLDSGCVWGKQLTAVRLDDGKAFQVDAA